MRIAVFGTGGVGGYFGGRLAQAGEAVIFIARGHHLAALQAHGLNVKSVAGDFAVSSVEATDDPGKIGRVDAVLVGVKAWQVPEAAQAIQRIVDSNAMVVPLQNGVEAPRELAKTLGREFVLGGLCRISSFISAPGEIQHTGIEPYIAFGELDNRRSHRVERLEDAFRRAEGLTVEIPEDIHVAMWRKFLLIAAWSGIGAITRAPIGVMRSLPQTRALLRQAMAEIVEVAQARAIALSPSAIAETMAFIDGLSSTGTASMQRDIMEGRPSELEAQSGAVVRLGQEVSIQTPLHQFIYYSLLPQERKARGELVFAA